MSDEDRLNEIIRQLADSGRLIEAGWESYRLTVLPKDAGRIQLQETRAGFYAGALHLFTSILSAIDPGEEASEADLHKMELIQKELLTFGEEFKANIAKRRAQQN